MVKTIFIGEYVQTILYHGPHHSFHPDTYPDFLIILVHYGNQGMIRLKDERRMIFQDAERLFKQDEGKKASFWKGKKKIEVWDLSGFEMEC